MKMAKAFLFLLSVFLFAAWPPPALASGHKNLTIGMSQYPSTLHPNFDAMVAKSLVLGTAQRPITAHDATWNAVCLLCIELPSFENGRAETFKGRDGKTRIRASYTIKDGIFWGDGTPLTTRDVLFAYEVGKHPQSGVGNGELFTKTIESVTAKDDKTFEIVFSKEFCDFAPIGDFYALPAHLEEKIFQEDPVNYKNRTLYNTDPANAGLYWGPYVVEKAESGSAITLARNAHWKGKAPAFDRVTFRAIENSAALSANLLSGGIDYIAGELGLSLDQAIAFEKRLPKGKFNVVYKPSLTFEHIDFNLGRAPFDDVRVRQALMYGMDREGINKALFGGRQPVALSDINPLDTVYTGDVKTYPHDAAMAGKLLDEAGWKKGKDGFRYNDRNEKLTVVLATTAGNKSRETIQQAIQADWKKIGVAAVIENEPARVLFGDTMRERRFKGGVMYAWMSSPRNIPKTTLHSSMVPAAENNYAGQNYPGYKDAEMDQILDDLETVCETEKNLALWHKLQRKYAEELPALPLYYRADSFFIPAWLAGVEPTGHLNPTTDWIENWSVSP